MPLIANTPRQVFFKFPRISGDLSQSHIIHLWSTLGAFSIPNSHDNGQGQLNPKPETRNFGLGTWGGRRGSQVGG